MRGRHSAGPSEMVMLVAISSALALAVLVWLWGGVAGSVFGDGWPAVSAGQLPQILALLPRRLSDPSLAWPADVRADLPGPSGFYGSLLLLGGAFALPTPLLVRTV